MAVAALVSLEEYLSTSYHPDCEFVEGRLVERNVGEFNHSFLQVAFTLALNALGLRTYTELRCQVKVRRYRIPDVLALAPGQKRGRRYQKTAPYIVVEILSPDDTVSDLRDKIDDYLAAGVPNIWVVDPKSRSLTVYREREAHTFTERVTTSDGAVSLDLADIFRRMAEDEDEAE
jgi:Uma2 family endonuclease